MVPHCSTALVLEVCLVSEAGWFNKWGKGLLSLEAEYCVASAEEGTHLDDTKAL